VSACGEWSAECGVRSAECGVRSAECGVRSAECGELRFYRIVKFKKKRIYTNSVFRFLHSVFRYRRHSQGRRKPTEESPPGERVNRQIRKKANFAKFRFLFSAFCFPLPPSFASVALAKRRIPRLVSE